MNKHLLWVDCIAAALGGGAVLLLGPWLPSLYGLPAGLLVFIGLANLAYGSYSFSPALLRRRPPVLITLLVAANGAWVLACLGMALHFAGSATWLGLGPPGGGGGVRWQPGGPRMEVARTTGPLMGSPCVAWARMALCGSDHHLD